MKKTEKLRETKFIGANIDMELQSLMSEEEKKTGIKQAEIIRRSIADRYEKGLNESAVELQIVLMVSALDDARDRMAEEDYQVFHECLNNIMILKGGK